MHSLTYLQIQQLLSERKYAMSIYVPVIQGVYTPLQAAVRNSTQTLAGKDIIDPNNANAKFSTGINPEASGLIAYLNVTAVPGVDAVQLVLEEQDPASGVWSTVAASTATAVTGMVKLKLKAAVTAVAASVAGVVVQDVLPAIWRLRVVHSAGSNFTYSLGVVLYN